MPSGSVVAWQGLHTVHRNAVVCVLWLEWQALGMFQTTTEGMEVQALRMSFGISWQPLQARRRTVLRLEGKPQFKEGGMSGCCLTCGPP
jgi:hypothetical protein